MKKTIGKYTYELSTRKGKKLMVEVDGKKIHFGSAGMMHYFDRTGLLPKQLNHLDQMRRQNFLDRMAGIKLKSGKPAIDDPRQPAWHAVRIIW